MWNNARIMRGTIGHLKNNTEDFATDSTNSMSGKDNLWIIRRFSIQHSTITNNTYRGRKSMKIQIFSSLVDCVTNEGNSTMEICQCISLLSSTSCPPNWLYLIVFARTIESPLFFTPRWMKGWNEWEKLSIISSSSAAVFNGGKIDLLLLRVAAAASVDVDDNRAPRCRCSESPISHFIRCQRLFLCALYFTMHPTCAAFLEFRASCSLVGQSTIPIDMQIKHKQCTIYSPIELAPRRWWWCAHKKVKRKLRKIMSKIISERAAAHRSGNCRVFVMMQLCWWQFPRIIKTDFSIHNEKREKTGSKMLMKMRTCHRAKGRWWCS